MGMSRAAYYYKPKNKTEKEKRDRDLLKAYKKNLLQIPLLRL